MRIGINCLRTSPNYKGGVNTYTFGILDAFARVGADHQFVIFVAPFNAHLFDKYKSFKNFSIVQVWEHKHEKIREWYQALPWWIRYRLPHKALNAFLNSEYSAGMSAYCDLIYIPCVPDPLFPLVDVPTVISIYDIQHEHYPQFFSKEELLFRKVTLDLHVSRAHSVQASSEFIKKDFIEHFGTLNDSNVFVVHEGVDFGLFSERPAVGSLQDKYRIPRDFLFFPAQLWHHKNHMTVLKALKLLEGRGIKIPMVLTGAKYSSADEVLGYIKAQNMDYIHYLGLVPYEDIIALYFDCKFLITAVLYESSSIPILEAAAAGTGIIASATPPNLESGEDLDINFFEPLDVENLASLLERIWVDESLRKKQIARNREGIRKFSWDNAALGYLSHFEKVCGNK